MPIITTNVPTDRFAATAAADADRTPPPPRTGAPPRPVGGIVSTEQLVAAGFTDAQVDALVRSGVIVPVHAGVFRTATTVMSPRRRLLACCLAVGGLVGASHRAAAWLWDLTDVTPPVEATTSGTDRPVPVDSVVHVRPDLRLDEVTVHRGVPVTTPARTLADLGGVLDRRLLAVAVDKALYLRLVDLRTLAHQCARANRAGTPGHGELRAILSHRLPRPGAVVEPTRTRN